MSELPNGWTVATLKTLASKIVDGSHSPPAKVQTGYPMLSARNVQDEQIIFDHYRLVEPRAFATEHQRTKIHRGDVLLTIVGAIGRTAVVNDDREFVLQRSVAVIGELTGVKPHYLSKAFLNPSFQRWLNDNAKGTAQRGIYLKKLGSARLPVPPLPEQQRIVTKIDSLSAKSKRAREQLDHLPRLVEKYKQAILEVAFQEQLTKEWRETQTDIESVAKLLRHTDTPSQSRGGREATATVKPGVAGLSVNDPGSEVPNGWAWVSLRRIARQETGHTPSRSHPEYWDGGIPWIGIRDAANHHGKVIFETIQNVSEAGLANSSARLLPAGTVCLSRTASVGYVTIMGRAMATSQDFATWTCGPALTPKYLMFALMSEGESIRNFGEGSTHTTIYFPEIRALHICLAPLLEQREIVRRIEKAFAWIDRLASEATSARKLIDHLDQAVLAKAFRGELVPQDPNDEPASVLLERIGSARSSLPADAQRRKPKR